MTAGACTVDPVWHATVLTLFPAMFPGPMAHSLGGRALEDGRWRLTVRDIRAAAADRRRGVDDTPYGGGAGMVLRPDIVGGAIAAAQSGVAGRRPLVYLTPRGRPMVQADFRRWAGGPGVCLLCGRYEGVDQRVLDAWEADERSLGDFVLSGGEPAALALLDGCVRLLPGVLGAPESLREESFEAGLLEYPHYTRPAVWTDHRGRQRPVPAVLTSGDHGKIAAWRLECARQITRERRPDLWAAVQEKDARA